MRNPSVLCCLLSLLLINGFGKAETLVDSAQEALLQNYLYIRGLSDRPSASAIDAGVTAEGSLHKCGMPMVADLVQHRARLDARRQSIAAAVPARYLLPLQFQSPSGQFLIHYSTTGTDAVYQSTIDNDGDGVPNYVESVADICDAVYVSLTGDLGYPVPPSDGFYPSGGTAAYDVYLRNLPSGFFGLAYPDSLNFDLNDIQQATSFIELDNDYQSISRYRNRPLDAVRVTVAHEYFHAVQFGIDISEAVDVQNGTLRRHWMEATAVWMEELLYDDVNDYYTYIDTFFVNPRVSLQRFNNASDLHPYGAAVFPIFLSEKYGPDLIRAIWFRCKELGLGGNAYEAVDQVLDSVSGGAASFASAMAEFSVWNYFTGPYRQYAPAGIGYIEGENYPIIPDTAITCSVPPAVVQCDTNFGVIATRRLPITVTFQTNAFEPQVNGVTYYRFEDLLTRTTNRELADSGEVIEISLPCDSTYTTWAVSRIEQLRARPNEHRVIQSVVPGGLAYRQLVRNPDSLLSITLAISPATTNQGRYVPSATVDIGYVVRFDTTSAALLPANQPSAILTPYPNPADIRIMGGEPVTFRFQVSTTDSLSTPLYTTPLLYVDLYTLDGVLIRQLSGGQADPVDRLDIHRFGLYEAEWDMTNADGEAVASGVYLAYARLYDGVAKGELLAEDHVKLLVVR